MTDETLADGTGRDCATALEEARSRLAAVLVGATDSDLDTVLIAGQTLSVLNEATPPLPPPQYPAKGIMVADGLRQALDALARACRAAPTVADAARFARAVDILATHPAVMA